MTQKRVHPAADALDWNEALQLISSLNHDERYRDAMLISVGCMLGLRVSDFVLLRWSDLLDKNEFTIQEKKTGKNRKMRINKYLKQETKFCYDKLEIDDSQSYIFNSFQRKGTKPLSRVRIHQILKGIKTDYKVQSATVFSCHSLRKTFGRRVWLNECAKGRGDQALELLKELFGHEHVMVTKRYLGIRQEEILSLYDKLIEN